MVARENKRIERMNTMPNIKVNIESLAPPIERIDKKFPTMPEIEMENFSEQGESQTWMEKGSLVKQWKNNLWLEKGVS